MPKQDIGHKRWAIAEGYIPRDVRSKRRKFISHETACLFNPSGRDAHVRITVYYADREPSGPYAVLVPRRRTLHLRFNELNDPVPIPDETDFSSLIESDVPIIVQHTRLDSRQPVRGLLSTIAFGEG